MKDNKLFFVYAANAMAIYSTTGCPVWSTNYTQQTPNLLSNIMIFDVNNDGREEVVTAKGFHETTLLFLDATNGNEILNAKIFFKEEEGVPELIIHADADNDGFDEIITTDPEGRIVIIDNGSPPESDSGTGNEYVLMAGTIALAIGGAAVVLWKKRK